MKLVDILARELKVWPESWGIFCVATKVEGNDAAWFNYRNPVFKDGGWQDLGSVELWLSQEPEDRKEVVVRRFDWQAAVDALNALNAPKVADGNERLNMRLGAMIDMGWMKPDFSFWPLWPRQTYGFERSPGRAYVQNVGRCIRKPVADQKPDPSQWDGEGLPPVGSTCEHSTDDNKNDSADGGWKKVKIVGHHQFHNDDYLCAVWVSGTDVNYSSEGEHFRPIRTAEQVDAEERETAIEEMVFGVCGCEPDGGNTSAFMMCGFLYDAGYRKQ